MNLALGVLRGRMRDGRRRCVSGRRHPDREALAISVARAAGGFRALGVLPGEPVLLIMRDSRELAVAWLGAVHAGAVAVAVSGRLAEADYRHILSDSGARYALVDESFVEARKVFVASAVALPAGEAVAAFDADADTLAFCLYSSGTTGRPKGMCTRIAPVHVVGEAFRVLGLSEGDAVLTHRVFPSRTGLNTDCSPHSLSV